MMIYNQSFDYLAPEQPTDEEFVIPFWTGESEAIQNMLKKIGDMSDHQLLATWDALIDYSSKNYYDQSGKIGMDTWADAIQSELSRRGLPIAY